MENRQILSMIAALLFSSATGQAQELYPIPETALSSTATPCPNCSMTAVPGHLASGNLSLAGGIDVDSLTPKSQSKALYEQSRARLKFEVVSQVSDVGISLQGTKMPTTGLKSSFQIPIPERDKVYRYQIQFDVIRNGKRYFKNEMIKTIQAGTIQEFKVIPPSLEDVLEGETIVFDIEHKEIAEGGKPPEKDSVAGD